MNDLNSVENAVEILIVSEEPEETEETEELEEVENHQKASIEFEKEKSVQEQKLLKRMYKKYLKQLQTVQQTDEESVRKVQESKDRIIKSYGTTSGNIEIDLYARIEYIDKLIKK